MIGARSHSEQLFYENIVLLQGDKKDKYFCEGVRAEITELLAEK